MAVERGLADKALLTISPTAGMSLETGRDLYLDHVKGAKITGGASARTWKRYRAVFDNFLPFSAERGATTCLQVTKGLLEAYARHLEAEGYAHATAYLECTTIKQFLKFLVEDGHAPASVVFKFPVSKPHDTDVYC